MTTYNAQLTISSTLSHELFGCFEFSMFSDILHTKVASDGSGLRSN